jgi:hypothetical protein
VFAYITEPVLFWKKNYIIQLEMGFTSDQISTSHKSSAEQYPAFSPVPELEESTDVPIMEADQSLHWCKLTSYSQAFENTSTSVAASQMRNALNNLADTVSDPEQKKV